MTTTFSWSLVRRQAVDRVVHPHELDVRLVDDDQHVRRHPREEAVQLGLGEGRAGGVVGSADQHDLGAVGDRVGHRVEVVPAVGEHRDPDRGRGRGGDRDRVGLEGPPGEDDLVAGIAERLHQLVDQPDRAGRHRQVVGGHSELLREGGVERGGAHVGVAVHRRDTGLDGLDHAGQWRVGILVRGELVRRHPGSDRRRLPGDVRRDLRDVRPWLGGGHDATLFTMRPTGGGPGRARCRCQLR